MKTTIHLKNDIKQDIILKFDDAERIYSNFYPCRVTLPKEEITMDNGAKFATPAMIFDSVEQAYMAWKTVDIYTRTLIQKMTPKEAKRFTHEEGFPFRADYSDEGRLAIMEILVRQKYSERNPDLMVALIASGSATIIEGNTWGDTFFGLCLKTGVGANHLGRITMKRRDELTKN